MYDLKKIDAYKKFISFSGGIYIAYALRHPASSLLVLDKQHLDRVLLRIIITPFIFSPLSQIFLRTLLLLLLFLLLIIVVVALASFTWLDW